MVNEFDVKTVAFGEQGSYFVLAATGKWHWKGNAPSGFVGALKRHRGRPIADVTWGPSDEWFIRFEDGGTDFVGSASLVDEITRLRIDTSSIKKIVFGADDSWVVGFS
jgi:hypothetical protein